MPAAVEVRTGAAEAEAAVAQGTGNGARSRGGSAIGGWLCVQWLSQGSAVVAGAGRRSDGGSGCEQVRQHRLGRIRARLGRGRRKLM